MHIQGVTY